MATGFKLCLWAKAYDYAVQTAIGRTFDEENLNLRFRNCFRSKDAVVLKLVKPTAEVAVLGSKLYVTLKNMGVTINHTKMLKLLQKKFKKEVSGTVEISIDTVRYAAVQDAVALDSLREPIYCPDVSLVNFKFSNTLISIGGTGIDFGTSSVVDLSQLVGPQTYSGKGQRITSTGSGKSIIADGVNQYIDSSGPNAVIYSSGVNSRIMSSGQGATIACHGTNGVVVASGVDAFIEDGGRNIGITCRGSNAAIESSGSFTTITAKGPNASINFDGCYTVITASGSALYDDFGRTLVSALTDAFIDSFNQYLPELSFQSGVSQNWVFHYGYLGSEHDIGNPVLNPNQTSTFPEPLNSDRMLTILISNGVINKVGSSLYDDNLLSYNLTQTDLIDQATQNNPAANAPERSRCLADCYPDLSVKYPGAEMEVSLDAIEAPTAIFSDQNLVVTLRGSAIFRARLPSGRLVDFLTTEVTLETTVRLEVKVGEMKGRVTSVLPKSIVVKTALESLNRDLLKEVIDLIAEQFLHRKLEEIAQKGIPLPLPLLTGVDQFQNAKMSMADDFLRIDTDVTFIA